MRCTPIPLKNLAVAMIALAFSVPARADLKKDLDGIRAAYDAYVQHYIAPAPPPDKPRPPPTPTVWESDPQTCKLAWSKVGAFLDKAEAAYDKSREWTGSAKVGFSSDSAGSKQESKTNIDTMFEAGQYPDQFRLEAGASLNFKNGREDEDDLTEDVTSILLNYDHYFTPRWEGFTFIERFTDSFMSIDQRYEVGTGIKREFQLADRDARIRRKAENTKEDTELEKYNGAVDALARALDKETEKDCLVDAERNPLKIPAVLAKPDASNPLHSFLDRATARFELGISLAVLAEFEQADTFEFQTQIPDADPTMPDPIVDRSFKAEGTQRYRLSLRPSLKWRITDEVSFSARAYYKPMLDSPRKVDGKRDYRVDAVSELKWEFGTIKPGSDKTTAMVLSYDWRYDSAPPNSTDFLLTLAPPGTPPSQLPALVPVIGRDSGEKRHSMLKLQLEVGF